MATIRRIETSRCCIPHVTWPSCPSAPYSGARIRHLARDGGPLRYHQNTDHGPLDPEIRLIRVPMSIPETSQPIIPAPYPSSLSRYQHQEPLYVAVSSCTSASSISTSPILYGSWSGQRACPFSRHKKATSCRYHLVAPSRPLGRAPSRRTDPRWVRPARSAGRVTAGLVLFWSPTALQYHLLHPGTKRLQPAQEGLALLIAPAPASHRQYSSTELTCIRLRTAFPPARRGKGEVNCSPSARPSATASGHACLLPFPACICAPLQLLVAAKI